MKTALVLLAATLAAGLLHAGAARAGIAADDSILLDPFDNFDPVPQIGFGYYGHGCYRECGHHYYYRRYHRYCRYCRHDDWRDEDAGPPPWRYARHREIYDDPPPPDGFAPGDPPPPDGWSPDDPPPRETYPPPPH